MQRDLAPQRRGFLSWARWWLSASHLMMWGLAIAAMTAQPLLQERSPHLASSWPIGAACILASLWMLWGLWPGSPGQPLRGGEGTILLLAVCWGVMTWQREHAWAVVGLCAATAVGFRMLGKIRRRSVDAAAVAWILAGIAVFFFQWPNSKRLYLAIILGGLGTAVQGGFDLVRHVRGASGKSDINSIRIGSTDSVSH
jgi:hypothetical protein